MRKGKKKKKNAKVLPKRKAKARQSESSVAAVVARVDTVKDEQSKRDEPQQNESTADIKAQEPTEQTDISLIGQENLLREQQEPPVGESAKPRRIWEVDFVRGLMILFVVWDHFMWDINSVGTVVYNTATFRWLYELSNSYYTGSLRKVTHDVFVTMFVLTSGVSCSFSRSNGRRALKMCLFAALFSAVTYAASAALQTDITIYFNVIHVIALSVAIYAGLEWIWSKLKHNWQKNIFGVCYFAITMTALVLGHCAKYDGANWVKMIFEPIFGEMQGLNTVIATVRGGGDYLSFIPDFGWFLVGAFLGKIVYRKRESVLPSVDPRYVSPITFCGRYSIWIYFGSQVVMFGLIYLLHVVYTIL